MVSEPKQAPPVVRTKLYRPPVAQGFVHRERLSARLDSGLHSPLTLVSAPAGYGKSTLISDWVETGSFESAWLSLDETESELTAFLGYLIEAVRTVFPYACEETEGLLEAPPPTSALAASLVNDLAAIENRLVLVLDDYHRIRDPKIHEVLDRLLEHPPPMLHLAIVTRRDPPLSLPRLRATGLVTELRMHDLQFSAEETAEMLESTLGSAANSAVLHKRTEGWPVALRLATAILQRSKDALLAFDGDTIQLQEYLVAEILAHESPEIRDGLRRSSIGERFSASFVTNVCRTDGASFLRRLRESGLPFAALDPQGKWYRYNHLFQDLLRRQLDAAEATELHRRASAWYDESGYIEEALRHALAGNDVAAAAQIVARRRQELTQSEQRQRLRRLLNRLPRKAFENDADLLLIMAWGLIGLAELPGVLDRIETILGPDPAPLKRAEIDTLRGVNAWAMGYADEAIALATSALGVFPREYESERGLAMIILALGHQLRGDVKQARTIVLDALKDEAVESSNYHTRLLGALNYVYWCAGDLAGMAPFAQRYLRIGQEHGLAETIQYGHYFVGIILYERNELELAEDHLRDIVENRRIAGMHNFSQCAFALALTYQAQGREEEAAEVADQVIAMALESNKPSLLSLAQGFKAELALRQGRRAEALRWAETYQPTPGFVGYRIYTPEVTFAQLRGGDTLEALVERCASMHNGYFLAKALAIKALLEDDEEALSRAVAVAMPSGMIRIFADPGGGMSPLLNRLQADRETTHFVGRVLSALHQDAVASPTPAIGQPLLDALTERELEILILFAERMSNKEISQKLFISPRTVKRHGENIYSKLGVHGRRDAVEKARGLGVL
jgi:LuxR family maltose regulon positive regulatory protein